MCLSKSYEHRRGSSAFISVVLFCLEDISSSNILNDVYNIQEDLNDHLFI
jgi:hypothetical protein